MHNRTHFLASKIASESIQGSRDWYWYLFAAVFCNICKRWTSLIGYLWSSAFVPVFYTGPALKTVLPEVCWAGVCNRNEFFQFTHNEQSEFFEAIRKNFGDFYSPKILEISSNDPYAPPDRSRRIAINILWIISLEQFECLHSRIGNIGSRWKALSGPNRKSFSRTTNKCWFGSLIPQVQKD